MKIISYWTNLWNPTHDSSNKKTQSPPLHERKKRVCRDRLSTARPTSQRVPHRKHWDALRYDGNVVGYTPRARGNPPFLSILMSFPAVNLCFGWGIPMAKFRTTLFFPLATLNTCLFHMNPSWGVENEQHGGTTTNHQKPFHGYMATYCLSLCWIYTTKTYYMTNPLSVVIPLPSHTHIATNTKTSFIMKLP